jgi:hypothetical protein
MKCPICLDPVKTGNDDPVVELCCGGNLYHRDCVMQATRWNESVIKCPVCREDVTFPVVYGNAFETRPGATTYSPFTRVLVADTSDSRERRDECIILSDYVMVTLDGQDCLDILADIKSALALKKPVYIRGSIPGGLAKLVNIPIPTPSTRKRKLEAALKDELLCKQAKDLLSTPVQSTYHYKGATRLTLFFA